MSEEIKFRDFRGKRIDNGEWAYGDFFRQWMTPEKWLYAIMVHEKIDGEVLYKTVSRHVFVEPETVGQFTGELDMRGVEIYEGDKVTDESTVDDTGTGFEGAVEFVNGSFIINSLNCECDECENCTHWPLYGGSIRVTGTIHDKNETL